MIETVTEVLRKLEAYSFGDLVAAMDFVDYCDNLLLTPNLPEGLATIVTHAKETMEAVILLGASDELEALLESSKAALQNYSQTAEAAAGATAASPIDSAPSPQTPATAPMGAPADAPPADTAPVSVSVIGSEAVSFDDGETLNSFVSESLEHLDNIQDLVLNLETTHHYEILDAVFRAMHTIKGISGFMGLSQITTLSHDLESLLDRLRKGELSISTPIVDVLLLGSDTLRSMLEWLLPYAKAHECDECAFSLNFPVYSLDALIARIGALCRGEEAVTLPREPIPAAASAGLPPASATPPAAGTPSRRGGLFASASQQCGGNTDCNALAVRTKESLLTIKRQLFLLTQNKQHRDSKDKAPLKTLIAAMGALADSFAAEDRTVSDAAEALKSRLLGLTPVKKIRFSELVAQIRQIASLAAKSLSAKAGLAAPPLAAEIGTLFGPQPAAAGAQTPAATGAGSAGVGSAAATAGAGNADREPDAGRGTDPTGSRAMTPAAPVQAPSAAGAGAGSATANGAAAGAGSAAGANAGAAGANGNAGAASAPSPYENAEQTSIRVDVSKLDKLFNIIGDLITAQDIVLDEIQVEETQEIMKSKRHLEKVTRELQELSMQLRMITLNGLFNKMKRVARDCSKKVGKLIDFQIYGQDKEMDRKVIDQISDPLIHIIRNALDHGIEPPEARRAAGKDPVGKVILSAEYEGNGIVISVKDDGAGLCKAKIIQKALQQGLITDSQTESLTDKKIYNLIFQPGFSTSETVSDISGRGVGMDVVKQSISQLRGSVSILSKEGVGSEFKIRIPLTLAIIDAITFKVGDLIFATQITDIVEFYRANASQISETYPGKQILNLRKDLIPVLHLSDVYRTPHRYTHIDEGIIIVASSNQKKEAIVVDEIIGTKQLVIKPLPKLFSHLSGLSGWSMLSGSNIALIIDMSQLIHSQYP